VTMERVEVGYVEGQPILKNLNLRIDEDDRIALLGPNGNGKSTFAKLLADRLKPQRGDMVRADKLEVAYLAQHQLDELRPGESPAEHVRRLMPDAPEARVRARAAEMGFSGGAGDTKVSALSGGEKARLLLGLAAFNGPHLLILDEPTNHLDIQSREALITAINDYPGAVILVSHDRHLLEACADRLWMVGNGTVKPYDGDLDPYRREVLGRTGRMTGEGRKDKETQETPSADAEGLALRKRVRDAEALMAKLEKDIAAIDKRLADPKLAKFPADEARLTRQRAEAVKALATAEENWIEASSALETVD
ncbi:MAG: glycosyl transferase family 1, partial [Azorhizobium sp. 39-67-5]